MAGTLLQIVGQKGAGNRFASTESRNQVKIHMDDYGVYQDPRPLDCYAMRGSDSKNGKPKGKAASRQKSEKELW